MPSIRLGEFEWAYRLIGANDHPPIVLLHGFTGAGDIWDEVATTLGESCRCLIPDLPGHGQTKAPTDVTTRTMEEVADDLSALCDKIDLDSVIVWGYSMGGRLALQWAVREPDRIDALVLESASPGIADASERKARKVADDQLAGRIESIGVEAFADEWMANPLFASQLDLSANRRELGRRIRGRNSASGLAMSLRGMGTGASTPLHEQLRSLPMPVLVLAGSLDAKFSSIGDQMSTMIPRASFRIVSGAGHAVSWERPAICVEIVRSFLVRFGIVSSLGEG